MSTGAISRFVLAHKRLVVLFWVVVTVIGFASTGPATEALLRALWLPRSILPSLQPILSTVILPTMAFIQL